MAQRQNATRFPVLCLNEGHLIGFFQGCDSSPHPVERRFAQDRHAFLTRRALDFRCRPPLQNHFANALREVQYLVNRRSSAESRSAALDAAPALVKIEVAPLLQIETALDEILF